MDNILLLHVEIHCLVLYRTGDIVFLLLRCTNDGCADL